MVPMGAPRARAVPDPVTKSGSAAAVLDFAVGQILRDDTALGALPAVLERLVSTFGLRAFHTARPDPFDLVVLDIGLPSMDGWAVLERIRDLSDVPVLILTAHGNEGDKGRGLHGGADDYLWPRCTTTASCGSAWTCARSAWAA